MVSSEGTRRPSLVDQHGTADFPLDAPDVSGLLRQSSVLSVRARQQTITRSTTLVVKMVEPQRLLLRETLVSNPSFREAGAATRAGRRRGTTTVMAWVNLPKVGGFSPF